MTIYAHENTLKFYSENSHLYYDTSQYNDNTFLNCLNMSPNIEYSNSMSIENQTQNDYTLYLKAIPIEDNPQCQELLKHIDITISLDDVIVYQGKADGKTYPDMTNSICLGDFKSKSVSVLSATVSLNSDYSINQDLTAQIDWKFFASSNTQDYNNQNIIFQQIEPDTYKTGDNFNPIIIVIGCLSMILFSITIKKNLD